METEAKYGLGKFIKNISTALWPKKQNEYLWVHNNTDE